MIRPGVTGYVDRDHRDKAGLIDTMLTVITMGGRNQRMPYVLSIV